MKEAGGKHSKEEYDNRIMEANATNVGAKKEKKQQKKDRFSEKMIIFAKWKKKPWQSFLHRLK